MSGMLMPAILIGSLLLASPALCGADSGAVVLTLKNGNTFAADSYSLDGGKIRLKFKVGEAAFPLDEVSSINNSSGVSNLLQDKGVRQAGYPSETTGPQVRQAVAVKAPPTHYPAREEAQRKEDPLAGEIDRFIDRYFDASEEQKAVLDANMDKIMAAFIGDGEWDEAGTQDGTGDNIDEASFEEEFLTGGER